MHISIEHYGLVQEGKDTSSEKVKTWASALENYNKIMV
jgi:hypothetical protein